MAYLLKDKIIAAADAELKERIHAAAELGLESLTAAIPTRKTPRGEDAMKPTRETAFIKLESTDTGVKATFGFSAPQAYWYEIGTSRQPARPVFRAAFQASLPQMQQIISGE